MLVLVPAQPMGWSILLVACLVAGAIGVTACTSAGQPASQPQRSDAALREMLKMPGESHRGPLDPATDAQKQLADRLKQHVTTLATDIGDRNTRRPEGLRKSVAFLTKQMAGLGYTVRSQKYDAQRVEVENLEVEIKGTARPDEIFIVGAHYDSVPGCPAANDNGSGVAAVIEMARAFKDAKPARTVRFVFFVNEEPPFFRLNLMGSAIYSNRCRERNEKIVGMISMETIGYYSDEKGTQQYPQQFAKYFPREGNFIAFVGNVESLPLVRQTVGSFRTHAKFPSEGIGAPATVPGIPNSDHASFWRAGYPALMITDTANYRYPHYHRATDTPDKLDYDKMARVVEGVTAAVRDATR